VGHSRVTADHPLAGSVLTTADYCLDLGVTTTHNLSMSRHISEITTKAHQRANCILRSSTSGDEDLFVNSYTYCLRAPFLPAVTFPAEERHRPLTVTKL